MVYLIGALLKSTQSKPSSGRKDRGRE